MYGLSRLLTYMITLDSMLSLSIPSNIFDFFSLEQKFDYGFEDFMCAHNKLFSRYDCLSQ